MAAAEMRSKLDALHVSTRLSPLSSLYAVSLPLLRQDGDAVMAAEVRFKLAALHMSN